MEIGKLTNEQLKNFVLNKLQVRRSEVLLGSGVGIDCALLDLQGDYCAVSTDPLTAAGADVGKLAVHICANDIGAAGAIPFAMLVTALLPPDYTLEELGVLMQDVFAEASKLGVDIVGGHTEVTDAVNKPVLSITALGRTDTVLRYSDIVPGDHLVLTKACGIEGALIICNDYPHLVEEVMTKADWALAKSLAGGLSVLTEAGVAKQVGVKAMHDITEGGVLGAAYEMAEAADLGLVVNKEAVPVHPLAQKICAHLGLDPYRLISSGSMLIACGENVESVVQHLAEMDVPAAIIGSFAENGIQLSTGEQIAPPAQDELFKVSRIGKEK